MIDGVKAVSADTVLDDSRPKLNVLGELDSTVYIIPDMDPWDDTEDDILADLGVSGFPPGKY